MTSEQKLLQLIRRTPKEKKTAVVSAPSDSAPQGLMTEAMWIVANRLLVVAIVVLSGVLAWRYTTLRQTYAAPVVVEVAPLKQMEVEPVQPAHAFDDVKGMFSSRNVFQPPIPDEPEEMQTSPEAVVVPPINLSQQYRVVGIVLGAQPTAIVENIQNSSTVFLSIGDKLDQAVVKEIHQDKVILEMSGQTVELKS